MCSTLSGATRSEFSRLQEFTDACLFQIVSSKDGIGSVVTYGEDVQLKHVSSGGLVTVRQTGADANYLSAQHTILRAV